MNIQPIQSMMLIKHIDLEEQQILAMLSKYGIKGTGNKSIDKPMLRRIELERAHEENTVTNKFLTVSKEEEEEIQAKKAQKSIGLTTELEQDDRSGAKLLGEQLYLEIQLKKKKEDI